MREIDNENVLNGSAGGATAAFGAVGASGGAARVVRELWKTAQPPGCGMRGVRRKETSGVGRGAADAVRGELRR